MPFSSARYGLRLFVGVLAICAPQVLRADATEDTGLTAMRRERATITGAGISVAHVEGTEAADAWEVNPIFNPTAVFTWNSSKGVATNFPNSVGVQSTHANSVAYNFYGPGSGMAPGVSRVDNYEASYFIDSILAPPQVPIPGRIINNSWYEDLVPDDVYDSYAAAYNVLFVSGMNNSPDTPHPPGSCYNGIGVGIISTNWVSSVGPTSNGRAKPDLVAPSCCASFSTPQVAGAAALLLQAGTQNDGGPNTAALATNAITVKALLINGAVKTTNWTNGVTRPLDARYGAGVLNAYNSDLQLRGQRRAAIATNSVSLGAAHPPTSATNNVRSLRGWDYSALQSTALNDRIMHYCFELPANSAAYSSTATLVWKKDTGLLSDLDLFLYDTRSNTLVTNSVSTVDNVEHIFIPRLPAGRYDLQVLKHGGVGQMGAESYALAFDFSPSRLSIALVGSNSFVSWPASPAGFVLQSTPALSAAMNWQTVPTPSVLSNSLNTVVLPTTSGMQFFRLFRP